MYFWLSVFLTMTVPWSTGHLMCPNKTICVVNNEEIVPEDVHWYFINQAGGCGSLLGIVYDWDDVETWLSAPLPNGKAVRSVFLVYGKDTPLTKLLAAYWRVYLLCEQPTTIYIYADLDF